ncbi:MAG TPA: hypothetical protein VK947_08195 [Planococcus sp. (in: firmicutes)]|nr:hypothetical protein [Planococcus sp. (in: firmicutes)]
MVSKMITLKEPSFRNFMASPKMSMISNILLLLVGVGYGAISIASNASYIMSFDSTLLQFLIVPLIFIFFGLLTAFITKIGLGLLLWAGAKGAGGKGLLRAILAAVPVAMIPGLLGVPYLTGVGNGSVWSIILLFVGVVWMYFVSVKIIQVTQNFNSLKSYIAVFFSFLFLASVYYLTIPMG